MKAITVRQPYASAIVLGVKDVENRTFSVPDDTWIAVHCSKRKSPLQDLPDVKELDGCMGRVIGFAHVKKCVEFHRADSPWKQIVGKRRKTMCWLIDKQLMLKPEKRFTHRGNLGLWTLPDEKVRRLTGPENYVFVAQTYS